MCFEWMYNRLEESRRENIMQNSFNKHNQRVGLVVSIPNSIRVDTGCAGDRANCAFFLASSVGA